MSEPEWGYPPWSGPTYVEPQTPMQALYLAMAPPSYAPYLGAVPTRDKPPEWIARVFDGTDALREDRFPDVVFGLAWMPSGGVLGFAHKQPLAIAEWIDSATASGALEIRVYGGDDDGFRWRTGDPLHSYAQWHYQPSFDTEPVDKTRLTGASILSPFPPRSGRPRRGRYRGSVKRGSDGAVTVTRADDGDGGGGGGDAYGGQPPYPFAPPPPSYAPAPGYAMQPGYPPPPAGYAMQAPPGYPPPGMPMPPPGYPPVGPAYPPVGPAYPPVGPAPQPFSEQDQMNPDDPDSWLPWWQRQMAGLSAMGWGC